MLQKSLCWRFDSKPSLADIALFIHLQSIFINQNASFIEKNFGGITRTLSAYRSGPKIVCGEVATRDKGSKWRGNQVGTSPWRQDSYQPISGWAFPAFPYTITSDSINERLAGAVMRPRVPGTARAEMWVVCLLPSSHQCAAPAVF